MEYEHNEIPEPTCKGWWWPAEERGGPVRVRLVQGSGADFYHHGTEKWVNCKALGPWTGPIPEPEDKPAPSEEDCEPRLEIDGKGNLVPCGSAPSEDEGLPSEAPAKEGEKWGRRFEELFGEEAADNKTVRDTERDAALRFRAECIAPYLTLVDAANCYVGKLEGSNATDAGEVEYDKMIGILRSLSALTVLPDQGEAGEDKPPASAKATAGKRVSDEELGRWIVQRAFDSLRSLGWLALPDNMARVLVADIRAKLAASAEATAPEEGK